MKHICELKREYEERTGKKVVIEPSYPYGYNLLSHEEVEKRFQKALRIPFWVRAKWFLENLTCGSKRTKT